MSESPLPVDGGSRNYSRHSHGWAGMTSAQKFNAMGAWFLGPRGENSDLLKNCFDGIVEQVAQGRKQFFPDDPNFITSEMSSSVEFKEQAQRIVTELRRLTALLGKHSVPFYSPRYAGHMAFDVSLPALVGYLAALQYNQNNVTPEASPFTSFLEWHIGQKLCHVLGYHSSFDLEPKEKQNPAGWGCITAGGSISNLESMWIARNLKYYPLAFYNAMRHGEPLAFISSTFKINLCDGQTKIFFECDIWELLNLSPTEIADIPGRLATQFGIAESVLEEVLEDYSIQTVGKQKLDFDFGITKVPQYLISPANHYSWPKSAAVTGIGRENLIELRVDDDARLDVKHLEEILELRLAEKRPVYAVVAIVGTTEHGAVDPVSKIVDLRRKMQSKGMSFMIHADAAWGGYFATKKRIPRGSFPVTEYAFSLPLGEYVNKQMLSLRDVDSITLDPHKSGYIPYPAGALCYRDGRHRRLTTWNSPVINVDEANDICVGIYGIQGRYGPVQNAMTAFNQILCSKPGASPVAVWLSMEIIGPEGYGHLLGTAMLTSAKMYARWATMTLEDEHLIVTPFNRLPSEREHQPYDAIQNERKLIKKIIVDRPNSEIEHDKKAMSLLKKLGSDLMINAFACNFRSGNEPNKDVVEASFLNRRLYQRLSVTTMEEDLNDKPVIVMGTEFTAKRYGDALKNFKARCGLVGDEDLYVLSNVSMSPWPTAGNFLSTIIGDFERIAKEEIKTCLVRVQKRPSIHGFVMHGTNTLYLVYLPMFHVANHQRHVIIAAKLNDMAKYKAEREKKPEAIFSFHTKVNKLETLEELLKRRSFMGDVYEGLPLDYGSAAISPPLLANVEISVISIIHDSSLHRHKVSRDYPAKMPFYVFGSHENLHIEHALLRAPNVQLSASNVKLAVNVNTDYSSPHILVLETQNEAFQHPFTDNHKPSFFTPGAQFNVSLYNADKSGKALEGEHIATGSLTLPDDAEKSFIDYEHLNQEAAADIYVVTTDPRSTVNMDRKIAMKIVQCFQDGHISWSDNVPNAILKQVPEAGKGYEIFLGPPKSLPDSRFVVLSRFLCHRHPKSLTETLSLQFSMAK